MFFTVSQSVVSFLFNSEKKRQLQIRRKMKIIGEAPEFRSKEIT